ncbi:MAG: hypothetical protein LBH11_02855, partial [Propionibacteriaceae bacterium]|nr:hypothetical protein [Propionibacteriaceae bacterium]
PPSKHTQQPSIRPDFAILKEIDDQIDEWTPAAFLTENPDTPTTNPDFIPTEPSTAPGESEPTRLRRKPPKCPEQDNPGSAEPPSDWNNSCLGLLTRWTAILGWGFTILMCVAFVIGDHYDDLGAWVTITITGALTVGASWLSWRGSHGRLPPTPPRIQQILEAISAVATLAIAAAVIIGYIFA